MKYLLKKYYYSICALIITLAAQGALRASLRSTRGAGRDEEVKTHSSQAPLPLLGTDFEDFTNHATRYADHLLAPFTFKKSTLTPPERWALLQQLRMHMIQYKHEEGLAIDRNGNAIPAALDHRESESLSNLITLADPIIVLPSDIHRILALFLAGNRTAISQMMRQLFGTLTDDAVWLPHNSIAMSSNGATIITGSRDHTAQIHRYNNTTHRWELQHTINHAGFIEFAAISADGLTTVTGSHRIAQIHRYNNTTHRWELQLTINHRIPWIHSTVISADGLTVVTGSKDKIAQIHCYNNTTHRWELRHTIQHTDLINSVAISADGSTVVTGSLDGTAQIHHCNSTTHRWELQLTIDYYASVVESIAISANGSTVVTGFRNSQALIHHYNNTAHRWEVQHIIYHRINWINTAAISSDGSTVATSGSDGTAQIHHYNNTTHRWERRHTITHPNWSMSVTISSDGLTVIAGSYVSSQIHQFNSIDNRWELRDSIDDAGRVLSVDGSTLIATNFHGTTRLYRLGLTEHELQNLMTIVATHFDVILLLQDIHNKNKYFPHCTITLTPKQHNILLKLPLHALKILLKRANIRMLPPVMTLTPSSSAAPSPGTTESQQLAQILSKKFFQDFRQALGSCTRSMPGKK